MQVDLKNLVSITEANQNFSKVAKMVDEKGTAVILKNNVPRYVIIKYSTLDEDEIEEKRAAADQTVEAITKKLLSKHAKAFEALAK